MKRYFTLLICLGCALLSKAQLNPPIVTINGDLSKYRYVYVIPTNGVTSNTGVAGAISIGGVTGIYGNQTNTINPSETISGNLMKMGYTILPAVTPEFAENTMIVSYGYLGKRLMGLVTYASTIIIQMRDAQTQELVASFETEGYSEDEANSISEAIIKAMKMLGYALNPTVELQVLRVYKRSVNVSLTNRTQNKINHIYLRLKYYSEGEVIHTQEETVETGLPANYCIDIYIDRDEEVCSKKNPS